MLGTSDDNPTWLAFDVLLAEELASMSFLADIRLAATLCPECDSRILRQARQAVQDELNRDKIPRSVTTVVQEYQALPQHVRPLPR